MKLKNIEWPVEAVQAFCERRGVEELALFGSVLTDEFRADSDIDVLYTLKPDAEWTFGDLLDAEAELAEILGRPVDLVSRRGVEASRNWIRRESILGSAERVYASE